MIVRILCVLTCIAALTADAAEREPEVVEHRRPAAGLTLHDLLALRDIVSVALSSDGTQLAFATRRAILEENDYVTELFVGATSGNDEPRVVGRLGRSLSARGTLLSRGLYWANDDKAVVTIADLDGRPQVWAWDVQGGPPRRLTNTHQGVIAAGVDDNGRSVFYMTMHIAAADDEREALARSASDEGMVLSMVPRHGTTASGLENTLKWGDYLGQRGVDRYVASAFGVRFEYWVFDLKIGASRRIVEESEMSRYLRQVDVADIPPPFEWGIQTFPKDLLRATGPASRGLVSPDGKYVAAIVEEKSGRREMAITVSSRGSGETTERYRVVGREISSLTWGNDSATLYFLQTAYTANGYVSQVVFLRRNDVNPRVVYSVQNAHIRVLQFDLAHGRATFVESLPTQPDRLISVNLVTGARSVLYDANPELDLSALPAPLILPLENRYGVRAFAALVPPVNRRPGVKYPMVVVTYRAKGFLRGGTGNEYPVFPLAAAGFCVLVLDVGEAYFYRRAGHFSIESRELSAHATLEDAVGASLLQGFVDRERIAITGLSYGAGLAWYALIHSRMFKAAIVSDSGLDPMPLYIMGFNPVKQFFPVPPGTRQERKRWEAVSPALNAKRIRTPILINDSDDEFWKVLQTTTTLTSLGKPWDMTVYPDADHNISRPAQKYSIHVRNVDWLRFWLLDEESREPGKKQQYARWRVLKEQHEWNERFWNLKRDPAEVFVRQSRMQPLGETVASPELAPVLRQKTTQPN